MSGGDSRRAWADFWSEGAAAGGGCLAGAGDELGAAQADLWRAFAAGLPRGGKVLDLGTGDGIVLRQLAAVRPDLKLTGIDSAPALPRASGKLRLMADVAMETLPFAGGSFAAVVSQFGYEYGDTARIAAEVARVLAPGGRVQLLVHHRAGPIVAHNRDRAAALRWAIGDSELLAKARALAEARQRLALPTPPSFREAVGKAARRFPRQPVAAEIAEAVRQSLALPPAASRAALAELERKVNGELLRLDALAAAARDEAQVALLADELRSAGLGSVEAAAVASRSGQPFGWRVTALAPA